jgi:hypothetical protein
MASGLRPQSRIFVKKKKLRVLVPGCPKLYTKFQRDWSNCLNVIALTKIQDGRQPTAAISEFLKILKLRVLALVGPK